MAHGIKEVTFNSGSRDAGKLSIQALINRYITATRLMRESPDIVDNARDVASRQREKAKQEIVELILANNGDDSFKVMLSTDNMKTARDYIMHGGDSGYGIDN